MNCLDAEAAGCQLPVSPCHRCSALVEVLACSGTSMSCGEGAFPCFLRANEVDQWASITH